MKIKHHIFFPYVTQNNLKTRNLYFSAALLLPLASDWTASLQTTLSFFLTAAHFQPLPSADVKCLLVEAMIAATLSSAV